jgi:hypothetical protein
MWVVKGVMAIRMCTAGGNVNDELKKKSAGDYTLMASSASFPFYGSTGGLRVYVASPTVEEDALTYSRGDNIELGQMVHAMLILYPRLEADI